MAEREFRTTPQWPIATTPLSGDELVEIWKDGKQYYVPFSELGGIPAAHQGSHQRGGADAVGTLEKTAYAIPYLESDGTIDTRVSDASTTVKGKVQLATSGEESATKAVTGTDARLSDARAPTAHAEQHIAGTDVIADATVSNSGLMSAADKVKADATIPEYIPTADQKAALVGTYGTPSETNRYVTEDDIGVGVCPLESGLVPSSNLPSYVDDVLEYANEAAFPAIGETGKIYVALDVNLTFRWSGSTYVEISKSLALGTTSSTAHRGDHGVAAYNHSQETGNPHGTKPSELSSLGTGWGTLLESDSNDRLPTSDQKAALTGTSGTPGAGNKYVTNADERLPTVNQKAALVGTSGTPSASNPFVTTTDPRLAGGGGDGTTDALVRAWASFFSVFSEEQPTGQTTRQWQGLASHDGDLYAAVVNGDIYKKDGAGIFQPTGQTSRQWFTLASHDGDLYATVSNGDIYKMDGSGVFQPTGQTTRNWRAIASHDGDLYAADYGGDVYKIDGAGMFQPTGQTTKNWMGLASHDGDLYATVTGDDIYKMDGSGVFQPTGQTTRNWRSIASHDGDLYASALGGDVYKMDGAGIFQATGQTTRSRWGLASHDGDLYATVSGDDIYLLTTSNPSVNISKSNYVVPISASFPINGRKVYRRTSAYDGNPVTITPPSGATFEGRASIALYGQYSYVELERISATVFAIKDILDEFKYVPSALITNLPGSWPPFYGKCVITKGKVFIRQHYAVSGAATGTISFTQEELIPAGLTIVSEKAKQVGWLSAGAKLGSGIFDGDAYFWTADGVSWNATVPITWKNGDKIYFYLEYTL